MGYPHSSGGPGVGLGFFSNHRRRASVVQACPTVKERPDRNREPTKQIHSSGYMMV